jgi:hypothetical protein
MGLLRLYRKFYCVATSGASNTYTPLTPTSVTASSFIAGTGGTESTTLIEDNIILIEEEVGIFYADLTPELYSSEVTYDLVFYVQYTPQAPVDKKLTTRFRIMPFNIANQLDFEISNSTPIEYEIIGTYN